MIIKVSSPTQSYVYRASSLPGFFEKDDHACSLPIDRAGITHIIAHVHMDNKLASEALRTMGELSPHTRKISRTCPGSRT